MSLIFSLPRSEICKFSFIESLDWKHLRIIKIFECLLMDTTSRKNVHLSSSTLKLADSDFFIRNRFKVSMFSVLQREYSYECLEQVFSNHRWHWKVVCSMYRSRWCFLLTSLKTHRSGLTNFELNWFIIDVFFLVNFNPERWLNNLRNVMCKFRENFFLILFEIGNIIELWSIQ